MPSFTTVWKKSSAAFTALTTAPEVVDAPETVSISSWMVEMEVTADDVDRTQAGGWNQGTYNKEVEIKLEEK